jgi:acyl dehydratase
MQSMHRLNGPYYDDLTTGTVLPQLPAVTITDADNVMYRSITGDENRLAADQSTYSSASGSSGALVNPGLMVQLSIGLSTSATRHAIANLFYRGVLVARPVEVGETVQTTTTVLGMADSRPKGDLNRGKVLLGIETVGTKGPIASYQRCALLPARGDAPGFTDDVGSATSAPDPDYSSVIPAWDLSGLPDLPVVVGDTIEDPMWDHVDLAPAFARMTFNQAMVHRSEFATTYDSRLVYGGHVIALAQASTTRVFPGTATVLGWKRCNHTAPAFEGDTLSFTHTLVAAESVSAGQMLTIETAGYRREEGSDPVQLLDWEYVVLHK